MSKKCFALCKSYLILQKLACIISVEKCNKGCLMLSFAFICVFKNSSAMRAVVHRARNTHLRILRGKDNERKRILAEDIVAINVNAIGALRLNVKFRR